VSSFASLLFSWCLAVFETMYHAEPRRTAWPRLDARCRLVRRQVRLVALIRRWLNDVLSHKDLAIRA
jgi:hypothetical protein